MKIALEGKRALIIGSGRLAAAIAAALAASGAAVTAAVTTEASDADAAPVRLDLSSTESAAATAAAYGARHGDLYLLVNVSGEIEADMRACDERQEMWFAHGTRAFAPEVKRVVNVISAAGVVAVRGAAEFSARQAGLAALSRALGMELGPDVIVNALAVGAIAGGAPVAEHLVSHTALKRGGTPEEYAQAVLFLADPRNSYTTGHVMCVDGGWSIGYARDF